MDKKSMDFLTAHFVSMELAGVQEKFTKEVFKIAKEYGVDEFDLMRKAATVIVGSADDPFFKEKVAPSVWEGIEEENKREE